MILEELGSFLNFILLEPCTFLDPHIYMIGFVRQHCGNLELLLGIQIVGVECTFGSHRIIRICSTGNARSLRGDAKVADAEFVHIGNRDFTLQDGVQRFQRFIG
ncbi:MAG: hypothetical protein BWY63_02707 [Chloroflexi bacterium ADurb.Bin360]|nr:MAG: hypothetical protein BWY63_02707 [Chloroflexi bacterium ADurb.Bin360]